MADSKITALAALTTADPANDMFPVVDVSDTSMAASGTTKRISINNILACSPSATLASATITGDLTVDTSTLKVDSGNDRVGVGTASPTSKLHVSNTGAVTRITITDDTTNGRSGYIESNFSDALVIGTTSGVRAIRFSPDNKPYYQIATDGVQTWLDGIGGTRMTLNSTGLGVGGSVINKLTVTVVPGTSTSDGFRVTDSTRTIIAGQTGATYSYLGIGGSQNLIYTAGGRLDIVADSQSLFLRTGTNNYLNLDSSGNVGIGVQPSAWRSAAKALQVGGVGCFWSSASTAGSVAIGRNVYENSAGDFAYIVNDEATFYEQTSTGVHAWYSAAAGTGTISFGSAKMTLDASGRLILLASTTTPATLSTNGQLTFTATSDTNLRFSYRGSDGVTRVANLTLA